MKPVRHCLASAHREVQELRRDVVAVLRSELARLRHDPEHRSAVLSGLIRGISRATAHGTRSTILWALTVVMEIALALLDALRALERDA